MEPSCPKCNTPLPEVESLEFRFCPHCGAEIAAESKQLDDAYLTMPPDPLPPPSGHPPADLSPQTEEKITVAGPFDDQTREPQPTAGRTQLRLKPPDTPPPASFFRNRDEKTHSIRSGENVPPKRDKKSPAPTKKRNIIIAALVILVMIILLLGGLFTF